MGKINIIGGSHLKVEYPDTPANKPTVLLVDAKKPPNMRVTGVDSESVVIEFDDA